MAGINVNGLIRVDGSLSDLEIIHQSVNPHAWDQEALPLPEGSEGPLKYQITHSDLSEFHLPSGQCHWNIVIHGWLRDFEDDKVVKDWFHQCLKGLCSDKHNMILISGLLEIDLMMKTIFISTERVHNKEFDTYPTMHVFQYWNNS